MFKHTHTQVSVCKLNLFLCWIFSLTDGSRNDDRKTSVIIITAVVGHSNGGGICGGDGCGGNGNGWMDVGMDVGTE